MKKIFRRNDEKIQKNKLVIILGVICLLFIMLCISVGIFFHLETIQVTGCDFYTEDEVTDEFQKSILDKNTVLFYIRYKYLKSIDMPFVDGFDIDFVNAHKVHINIYEKAMISCLKYMGQYVYLDKDGVIVEISDARMEDIPLVTGIKFSKMTLYEKLDVDDDSIFNTILDISLLIQRYNLDIDKIYFNYSNEVTLYSGEIKILLGNRDSYDAQVADLKNLLPVAKEKGLKGVLDMQEYEDGEDEIIFRAE